MPRQSMPRRCYLAFLLGLVLACGSTWAAGLVEGFTPVTATEGLLFGLTHPVTGIDHLGAIIAAATVAAMLGCSVRLPLLFVPASFVGIRLHGFGIELPLPELMTALSAYGFGLVLVFSWLRSPAALSAPLLAAGLAHGYAYGEHVAATATATFLGAILGLGVVQCAMVVGVFRTGFGCATRQPARAADLYRTVGGYSVMMGTIALLLASI
jgi:urease accessory protein